MTANLPYELWDIILSIASPDTVVDLCLTSNQLRTICSQESFWKQKFAQHYPQYSIPKGMTYKSAYTGLARGTVKVFPVYFNGKEVFKIWVNRGISVIDLFTKIQNTFDLYKPPWVEIALTYMNLRSHGSRHLISFTGNLDEVLWTDVTSFTIENERY